MNQRQIGIIVAVVGILLASMIFFIKVRDDKTIDQYVQKEGTCYLDDGTCLHEQGRTLYTFGGILAAGLLILGGYLIFFDKTQKELAAHHLKVSSALAEARKKDRSDAQFKAFLAGFNEEEKKVISAVKEQDGILQSTLRYRTGISKSSLSLLLKDLEDRGFVTRKESGKTNQVFLRKSF